jgi:hypothetical protein
LSNSQKTTPRNSTSCGICVLGVGLLSERLSWRPSHLGWGRIVSDSLRWAGSFIPSGLASRRRWACDGGSGFHPPRYGGPRRCRVSTKSAASKPPIWLSIVWLNWNIDESRSRRSSGLRLPISRLPGLGIHRGWWQQAQLVVQAQCLRCQLSRPRERPDGEQAHVDILPVPVTRPAQTRLRVSLRSRSSTIGAGRTVVTVRSMEWVAGESGTFVPRLATRSVPSLD